MNNEEAIVILGQQLDRVEASGYDRLSNRIGQIEAFEFAADSGQVYQLEIQVFWDHRPHGVIRVLGSIDDGGWRAFLPLTDSRLVSPPTTQA